MVETLGRVNYGSNHWQLTRSVWTIVKPDIIVIITIINIVIVVIIIIIIIIIFLIVVIIIIIMISGKPDGQSG